MAGKRYIENTIFLISGKWYTPIVEGLLANPYNMTEKKIYTKQFDEWNEDKKILDRDEIEVFPKEREIWNIKLWVNIGSEADGKRGFYRPALVIARFGSMYLVVPMTSRWKKDSQYYYSLESVAFHDGIGTPLISSLLLSHIRTIDKRRFYKHKWTISTLEFENIQKILQNRYFGESWVISSTEVEWGARGHL